MEMLLGRKQAVKFLDLKPPQKIVDVATGTGTLAYEFAKLGHSVTGIDSSGGMIAQAGKRYSEHLDLHFRQADAILLPFENNEFDAASISFALHDMRYGTEIQVLEEMKRVTRPNGRLLIVDYNEPRSHWAAELFFPLIRSTESNHLAPFVNRGLESLLQEVKLKISRKTTVLGVIQIVVVDC